MVDTRESRLGASPSSLPPSQAEGEAWRALPRDEQVARYREVLHHPDRDRISDATMPDVLTKARRRVAARRNG